MINENKYEYDSMQFIGKISSEIYRRGYTHFTKKLVPLEINFLQMLCLISLYIMNGQTQESLADDISIDKSSIHRAVRSLEEKGLVKSIRNKEDKRALNIFVTDAGYELQPIISQIAKERESTLSLGVDPKEKEIAFKVLKQIADNAQEIYLKEKE